MAGPYSQMKVGLLLLVMGVDGYLGYKSARPKHTLGSPAIIPYTKLKADPAPKSDDKKVKP